jgi:hypothetical protein
MLNQKRLIYAMSNSQIQILSLAFSEKMILSYVESEKSMPLSSDHISMYGQFLGGSVIHVSFILSL